MHTVSVRSSFSAAHNLRSYKGKCEKVHGHNWIVKAAVASRSLDKQGMVVDFTVLKKALKDVLEGLDHSNLNEHPYFRKFNPSSENIAKFIYDRLKPKLYAMRSTLYAIKVWETENSCAEYRGE